MHSKPTILAASKDPQLADIREHVLTRGGYNVILVSDLVTLPDICKTQDVGLFMIGYSLTPAEKRRFWDVARKSCDAPILELHSNGEQELFESHALFAQETNTPTDFLVAVDEILRRKNR